MTLLAEARIHLNDAARAADAERTKKVARACHGRVEAVPLGLVGAPNRREGLRFEGEPWIGSRHSGALDGRIEGVANIAVRLDEVVEQRDVRTRAGGASAVCGGVEAVACALETFDLVLEAAAPIVVVSASLVVALGRPTGADRTLERLDRAFERREIGRGEARTCRVEALQKGVARWIRGRHEEGQRQ